MAVCSALPHFSCVIVDEAAQCCELDILVPLQYGSSKLILVGDPEQLPATVLSMVCLLDAVIVLLWFCYGYMFFVKYRKLSLLDMEDRCLNVFIVYSKELWKVRDWKIIDMSSCPWYHAWKCGRVPCIDVGHTVPYAPRHLSFPIQKILQQQTEIMQVIYCLVVDGLVYQLVDVELWKKQKAGCSDHGWCIIW